MKFIVAYNRYIDPITTRQEQQLIKITDKLETTLWIKYVFRSAHPAIKAGYGLADAIVDEEIAGYPWDKSVDTKNEAGRLPCFAT